MSDLINRQDAIDALCSVCGNDCDKTEFVYNAPQWEQVIICPEHYALSTLPSAESEQRWIPCSERLPNDTGLYLITTKLLDMSGKWRGDVTIGARNFNTNKRSWFGVKQDEVLAWMPLPDAYKEDD